MASQPKPRYTPEEYLAMEREAEFKSEYLDGEIIAMVGASEPHNLIVVNIVTQINTQLKKRPCKVYSSDMRVDVREHGLYAYPDVVVLCGEAKFRDKEMYNLLNPTVIIEVLSKSTQGYDRWEKFVKYRRIESLAEYLLVAQDKQHIEHYIRQSSTEWLLSEVSTLKGAIRLPSIDCKLKLAEVYDKVKFSK
ncbi:MAG TPA: Uma2 family endonuclease [Blastocatellia bacterium]|nr:Uma2 family endonuclease [Blastocatellia bacterium]